MRDAGAQVHHDARAERAAAGRGQVGVRGVHRVLQQPGRAGEDAQEVEVSARFSAALLRDMRHLSGM